MPRTRPGMTTTIILKAKCEAAIAVEALDPGVPYESRWAPYVRVHGPGQGQFPKGSIRPRGCMAPDARHSLAGDNVIAIPRECQSGVGRTSLRSRPREGGDPEPLAFVVIANVRQKKQRALSPHDRCGVWVPAFAGTTCGKAAINRRQSTRHVITRSRCRCRRCD